MGRRLTSRPLAIRTPVPGSAASLVIASSPTWPQRMTRSGGPTLTGPQTAPAATDVVRSGGASVLIVTPSPASARQIPVVSPLTPAPTTRASIPRTVSFPVADPLGGSRERANRRAGQAGGRGSRHGRGTGEPE